MTSPSWTSCHARAWARSASSCSTRRRPTPPVKARPPTRSCSMTVLTPDLLTSFDASVADVATAETMPPAIYTPSEFLEFEKPRGVRPRVAVRRSSPAASRTSATTSPRRQRRADHRRAGQGRLRCAPFSSICQHRGMQVADGEGNCTKFTCPYHLWSYDLTGRLLGAPAMERTARLRQEGLPTAGARGRAVAGLRVRPLRPETPRRWPRRSPPTSRSSSTTTSSTPSARARSPSATSRGTGR